MKNIWISLFAAALFLASCEKQSEQSDIKVTTIAAPIVYSDEVTLKGDVKTTGRAIAERGFYVSESSIDRENPSGEKYTAESDEFIVVVSDLTPLTQYYALAYVVDGDGKMHCGYELIFKTTKEAILLLSGANAASKTAKTAVLSAAIAEDSDIPASKFGVKYWLASEDEPEELTADNYVEIPGAPSYLVRKGNSFEVPVSGLTKNTQYKAKVFAQNDSKGVFSTEFAFSTLEIVAPTVSTGESSDMTAKSARISGCQMTFDGNDIEATYGIVYKKDAAAGDLSYTTLEDAVSDGWTVVDAVEDNPEDGTYGVVLTSLDFLSSYGFAAYARNDDFVAFGSVVSFQTLDIAVPTVTAYDFDPFEYEESVDLNSLNFKGKLVANGGSEVTEYGFYVSASNDMSGAEKVVVASVDIAENTDFSGEKTGLTAATTYYYQAYATNVKGEGKSDVKSISTAIDGGFLLVRDDNSAVAGTFKESTTPLKYRELPPVTVADGKQYIFMDRNLGATKAYGVAELQKVTVEVGLKEFAGYYYQFGNSTPAASQDAYDLTGVSSTDLNTTWYKWPQAGKAAWAEGDDPCRAYTGYRMITKDEMTAVMTALTAESKVVKDALLIGVCGFRQQAKGGLSGNPTGAGFYTSTAGTAYDASNATGFKTGTNKNLGVPVRCVRVVEAPLP